MGVPQVLNVVIYPCFGDLMSGLI